MLGIVIIVTMVEHIFIVVPFLPPHTKPGFANIIVMFCVFSIGKKQAVVLNILKSFFVLITRGPLAGALSLTGGLLSIGVILLLASIKFRGKGISYAPISVSGAIFHNVGQFVLIIFLMATSTLIYYIPVLIISGVVTGIINGILLKILMPILSKNLKLN